MIEILEIEDILDIHSIQIERYGGDSNHYDHTLSSIDRILNNVYYPLFGIDKYDGLFPKAGALLYFFAKDHCFTDGNKRVAAMTCTLFLLQNGYDLTLEEDELAPFVESVAASEERGIAIDQYITDISMFLKENSIYVGEI